MSAGEDRYTFSSLTNTERWPSEPSTLVEVREFERERHVHRDRFTVSTFLLRVDASVISQVVATRFILLRII